MKVEIQAIEYYLPEKTEDGKVLKNDNPDWRIDDIEKKTGVYVRHIAEPGQTAVDLALIASEKLFSSVHSRHDIDFIIMVTQSPDYALPTSACILQDRLGIKKDCAAFDVNLGCSGFVYALAIGGSMLEAGIARKGLIVCSETYTKYIDKSDRTCRPLFSDGGAAIVLAQSKADLLGPFELGTDGSGFSSLIVPSSGARKEEGDKLVMDGAKVFMFTMDRVPKCVNSLLEKAGKTIEDIDLFVFHQASKLVMENIIRRLQLPEEKVFINCQKVGNTVSASIPIALKDAAEQKRLKKGDQVMLIGFGVGLSWGGCLIKWGENQ
ncbi:MAG: ketoacyl-ACP synthase III [bacterium]